MYMEKISYNKLVRDRIPEIMEGKGKQFKTRTLSNNEEFEESLFAKLLEEAAEVGAAQGRDEIVKELADLAEVVKTISELKNIDSADIEAARVRRREERGGFEKRLLLVWGEKD